VAAQVVASRAVLSSTELVSYLTLMQKSEFFCSVGNTMCHHHKD
jgi:hypothetical protein